MEQMTTTLPTESIFPPAPEPAATLRSDRLVQPTLEMLARFEPEQLGRFGFTDVDKEITCRSPDREAERIAAYESSLRELEHHHREETDPAVQLDLEIVRDALALDLEKFRCESESSLPYYDPLTLVFHGLQPLLIDPVAPHRRDAAVTRLRRYVGLENGYVPLTRQCQTLLQAHLGETGRLGPCAEVVEADIARSQRLLTAIGRLFDLHQLEGHESALEALRRQLADHHAFLRSELLPRSPVAFHLPGELFDLELRRHGVDLPTEELARRAQVAFHETQGELRGLGRLLARKRSGSLASYQEIIRELHQEQVEPSRLSMHYQQRLAELAQTGDEAGLPPLPAGRLHVRVASEAEMLFLPAPFLRLPRFLQKGAEPLEIVVPLAAPDAAAGVPGDHVCEVASWWLAAHEGWPGHGLQFAKLLDQRLPIARKFFGYETAVVEGWALYAEAEIRSQLPLTAQLVILQQQLLRCARAWLGIALQQGAIGYDDALGWLCEKVGVSACLARVELRRALLRPTADVAYLAGYLRLTELRAEAERASGPRFDARGYHEALLACGLVPLARLRRFAQARGRATT